MMIVLKVTGVTNDVSSKVKATCAIYPPTTIRQLDFDPLENAYAMLMGSEASEEDYKKASPMNYVSQDFPPCMLVHGSTDSVVPLKESTSFYDKLKEKKYTCFFAYLCRRRTCL